jgi:protein arginine N-methyltransferase 2
MIAACASGDLSQVKSLLDQSSNSQLTASLQDETTGQSPLMAAAEKGHVGACHLLLEQGAPWNAVDRRGRCAGNYATDAEHWDIVNLLVEHGTKAELILGASMRSMKKKIPPISAQNEGDDQQSQKSESSKGPVEWESSTKPDYLERNVRYNADGTLLLDDDDDAVMMEWERPLMDAHASIITSDGAEGKRVMNVGFGLGIVDAALQQYEPSLHIIIEAHPGVHAKMLADGWDKKPGVRVEFGKWQDVLPNLIAEGVELDGIFYDTYGEHYTDMEEFHEQMAKILAKPGGIYSFFNGLAPDNLFFHGVACNCVKIQLSQLGLDTEFAQCQIQVKEKDWEGVRRKYWHGRETYYLPIATWSKEAVLDEKKKEGDSATLLKDPGVVKAAAAKDDDEKIRERDGYGGGPDCKKLKA